MGEWKLCRDVYLVNYGCLLIVPLGIWWTTESITAVLFGFIGSIHLSQSISMEAIASLKEHLEPDDIARDAKG